jgi:RNA polymerase sigma factor (sigma-70 family)
MATAQLGTVLRHIQHLSAGRCWTDRQLLDNFSSRGDESAFAALVGRHGPMVLRVCRRVLGHEQDAEDAFQATFLVLARNIPSIRKYEALAAFLHGVAYRTAMKAKRGAARRRLHERRCAGGVMRTQAPAWSDVQTALDEEIQRLPEQFRTAFVLCVLEGKSGPEAALLLGCREGTVSSRLTRARKILRLRLARRGIELSTLLAALDLSQNSSKAAVPAMLAEATVRMGLKVAAGDKAAAALPAHLANLATRVVPSRLHLVTALVLAAGLVSGAAALGRQGQAAEEKPPAETAAPPAAAALAPNEQPMPSEITGRVVDPDGRPLGGAQVHLIAQTFVLPKPLHVQTTSGADGGFRLVVKEPTATGADTPYWSVQLLATAQGFGFALQSQSALQSASGITLRLARDDVPIRGRVVDLQGKPIAGVAIEVESVGIPRATDLTPWLGALAANPRDAMPIEHQFLEELYLRSIGSLFPRQTTDAEGRFAIRGVGRERLAHLTLQGPTIVSTSFGVRTRAGKPITANMFAYNPDQSPLFYYGAAFEHSAAPTRPIVGVVRDKATNKPLEGVTIRSDKFAGDNVHGDGRVQTVTDKEGKFRLLGMPKGEGNIIKAVPAPGQPYSQQALEVKNPTGIDPVRVDFSLTRGVLVRGHVLDKVTRQPVYANVLYVTMSGNPFFARVPGFHFDHYLQTGQDGTFQLVALPGQGLIAARGWNDHFRMGVGADQIKGKDERGMFVTSTGYLEPDVFHTYTEVNPAEGTRTLECDLLLDPGTTPRVHVVDPDGKPMLGTRVLGATAYSHSRHWTRQPLQTATLTIWGLGERDSREVVFLHEGRRLAGAVTVRGNAREPLTVRMQPWAIVTGRLVGAKGEPRPSVLLRLRDDLLPNSYLQTDKDGRFRIEGLACNVAYTLEEVRNGRPVRSLLKDRKVKPGETLDLGDVTGVPQE